MSGKKEKEDCGCSSDNQPKKACPPVRNVTHPLRYYEFTQDEIKALEECDKESFYQRCLPFSTLFAAATYAGIKYRFLSKHPHFGAVPKVLLALCLGHLCGRLAYIPHCESKLRGMPGHLGSVLRQYHSQRYPPPPKK